VDDYPVMVRFSEVHWFEVRVMKSELDAANGGRDCAGIAGPTGDYPDAVGELLTSLSIDQSALREIDGQEVNGIRRA